MTTFGDYIVLVNREWGRTDCPSLRLGQVYYSVLERTQPHLANVVVGTRLDPYHRDNLIPEFLVWLAEAWPKESQ